MQTSDQSPKAATKNKKWFWSQTVIIAYIAALAAVIIYSFWAIQINKPQQSTTHATACTPDPVKMQKLINTCRPWLAMSAGSYPVPPAAGTDKESQILYSEKYFGKQVDAVKVYHQAGDTLNKIDKDFIGRANTFLMVNWKPTSGTWADVNANNTQVTQDIRNMADSIRAQAPHTIMLAVWHEPENDVSTGTNCTALKGTREGSPQDYINMWHYVRQIFDQEGVSNVAWAMDYENYQPFDCLVPLLYPGDSYVDWILFNAYNRVSGTTFSSKVTHFMNLLDSNNVGVGKQLGIGEWSDNIGSDNDDAIYINQAQKWVEDGWLNNTNPQSKRIDLYMTFNSIGPDLVDYRMGYENGALSDINGNGDASKGPATRAAAFKRYEQSAAFQDGSTSTPPPSSDTTPPTVSVSTPADGATVSGTVTLSANASDNVGVTGVKFVVDSTVIKNDTTSSDGWSTAWDSRQVANGTHTVTVTASDAAGNTKTSSSTIAVNNTASPTISSLTANPASVASGNTSTLSWAYSNTPTCSLTPGGPTNTTATSWQTGALSSTTTFTLNCGGATKSVTVTVVPAPAITSFQATPATTTVGSISTFSWSTTNTAGCSLTPGGPTNTTATSWQTLTLTTTGTTTYTLTCKNSAGQTSSATTTLTVNPAPVPPSNVILSASASSVTKGSSVTLKWTSNGSSSCTLNPGNLTALGTTGSKTISNMQSTTTYTVTCANNAGRTNSNSVTVTVTNTTSSPGKPHIISFTATPSSLSNSGTSVLAWQTSNVAPNGCRLSPSPLARVDGIGRWTTPILTTSTSYTLTCTNGAGKTASKSLSVIVAATVATAAPAPATISSTSATSGTRTTLTATTGEAVTNITASGSVTQGSLATLDSATVNSLTEVKSIDKVEFYINGKLAQADTTAPYALQTTAIQPASYTITQRTYFKDGSVLQQTQLVSVTKKKSNLSSFDVTIIVLSSGAALLAGLVLRRAILQRQLAALAAVNHAAIHEDPNIHTLPSAGSTQPQPGNPHDPNDRPR
ncbi:MAG TPA: Ig-like domain-containing protein [Candidatus Saccharimonadales bacterium]|nr:Ig-like domain-containing protein [Candidatus Saccharimonadales bacterium]